MRIGVVAEYYALGDFQRVRALCESDLGKIGEQTANYLVAMTYHNLDRHGDAEASLGRLSALQGKSVGRYERAAIYAQWGGITRARDPMTQFATQ